MALVFNFDQNYVYLKRMQRENLFFGRNSELNGIIPSLNGKPET